MALSPPERWSAAFGGSDEGKCFPLMLPFGQRFKSSSIDFVITKENPTLWILFLLGCRERT
jgi:hypothetical protein